MKPLFLFSSFLFFFSVILYYYNLSEFTLQEFYYTSLCQLQEQQIVRIYDTYTIQNYGLHHIETTQLKHKFCDKKHR